MTFLSNHAFIAEFAESTIFCYPFSGIGRAKYAMEGALKNGGVFSDLGI
jgi:hypothetical protein